MIDEMISLPGAKPTKVEENAKKILSIIAYIGLVSAEEKHPQQRHVFVGNLVLCNRLISAIPFNCQLRNS